MIMPNFNPFPQLSTTRLVLRQITDNDAGNLFRLRSDTAVMQYICRPVAQKQEDVLELIRILNDSLQNNSGITWGITLKTDNRLAGTIGFWKILKEHHRAEIGYLLAPELQGNGLMQEAITAVLAFGFENIKLHSVEAVVNPRNLASAKLLERNSFIKEAHFKQNCCCNGQFADSDVYSLLTTIPHS